MAKTTPIRSVAVLGAGTMGAQIAAHVANAGLPVVLLDVSADAARDGLAALGSDFADHDGDEQDRRLDADPAFKHMLYKHACEGCYGAPEYGGNRDLAGWQAIQFAGDVQPRGYTDLEVSGRA